MSFDKSQCQSFLEVFLNCGLGVNTKTQVRSIGPEFIFRGNLLEIAKEMTGHRKALACSNTSLPIFNRHSVEAGMYSPYPAMLDSMLLNSSGPTCFRAEFEIGNPA
jgi:hypothetical protein